MEQVEIDYTQQGEDPINEDQVVVAAEESQKHDSDDEQSIDVEDDQDLIIQPITFNDEEEEQQATTDSSVSDFEIEATEDFSIQGLQCYERAEEELESQQTEEEEEEEEDSDQEPESMDTGSDNEQPKSTASPTNIKVQPYDENHVNLVHYNPLATAEENLARARNLDQRGIFFTKDAYDYYHPSEYADLFSLSDAYHDASIALSRENFAKEQGALQEDPVVVKREESVQEDNPSVSIGLNEEKLAEEQDATALKRKLSTEEIPREVVEEKSKKPKPDVGHSQKETTVIDQVLTSMLRAKQPHQQQLQREPSDLEIVAMAAGLGCYQQGDGNAQQYQQPTSRYTKEQHRKFLENAAELRRGGQLSEADNTLFQKMCQELKVEKSEFIQHQRKKLLQSGVYSSLDPKVEKMIEAYYELERARIKEYPQYYKYFNILDMPSGHTADQPILSFKKSLYGSGHIAPCLDKIFDTPRKLDLFKQYLSVPSKETNDDDSEEHYKKKLPPNLSTDPVIPSLLTQDTNNKPDIMISSECLVSFVEMFNDLSKDICIPIVVIDEKTIIFDNPLPKETLTARERNKIVYDWVFKSFCLDWKKRKLVTPIQLKTDTPQNKLKTDDLTWDNELDENLQYNMWAFGDVKILIRHQMDGDYRDKPRLRGSKEKVVCLITKLDYQISEGAEEMVTPAERASNWIRSYIGGHTTVFEGRIDVVNNRLVRVDRKEMLDIMSDNWRPSFESETLRHTFLKLKKTLLPGNYILRHKPGDRNFLVYQSMSTRESSVDIDLYAMLKEGKPAMGSPENSFIPAWPASDKYDEKERIAWTFPPK